MSQKVRILGVKHSGGAVYLGRDSCGNDMWSRNPERIIDWLCDGWRSRFNQHRAQRLESKPFIDEETGEKVWIKVPLGGVDAPEPITDAEARKRFSWLSAIPAMVIQTTSRIENTDWFAALKRRKTTGKGSQPGFRSRRKSPQTFMCWFNGGQNAVLHRTGRKVGVVTIFGQNPKGTYWPGEARWQVKIKVRLSEDIRSYTNVNVNWTARTLVFTSAVPERHHKSTGKSVGIDRGVVNTLTTSDGEELHLPRALSDKEAKEYLRLQRKMARQDRTNEALGGKKAKWASKRRQRTLDGMRRIMGRQTRRAEDWLHKETNRLVQENDTIVLEDLKPRAMAKNGGRYKAGLNRAIYSSRWGRLQQMLAYKAEASGVDLILVNPAYTSQMCNVCGHIARENRESQAAFLCVECGYADNADINAAKNILDIGLGRSLGRRGEIRPPEATASKGIAREASTPALAGRRRGHSEVGA